MTIMWWNEINNVIKNILVYKHYYNKYKNYEYGYVAK